MLFRLILVVGLGLGTSWLVDATQAEAVILLLLVDIVFPDIRFKENNNGDDN